MAKSILNKIENINKLVKLVNESENVPYTYNGGTFPQIVYIKPITIKNQFVYIEPDINGTFISKKERYNINKVSNFGDDYCKKHLEYTLNVIYKTFLKTLNK